MNTKKKRNVVKQKQIKRRDNGKRDKQNRRDNGVNLGENIGVL